MIPAATDIPATGAEHPETWAAMLAVAVRVEWQVRMLRAQVQGDRQVVVRRALRGVGLADLGRLEQPVRLEQVPAELEGPLAAAQRVWLEQVPAELEGPLPAAQRVWLERARVEQ